MEVVSCMFLTLVELAVVLPAGGHLAAQSLQFREHADGSGSGKRIFGRK